MSFDPVVANAGRLQILTALAVEERQEFMQLRRATRLTDGNLASHSRRLQLAGLIAIDKQIRDGKPVTNITLTSQGRRALESHTRRLVAAISHRRLPSNTPTPAMAPADPHPAEPVISSSLTEDDWID